MKFSYLRPPAKYLFLLSLHVMHVFFQNTYITIHYKMQDVISNLFAHAFFFFLLIRMVGLWYLILNVHATRVQREKKLF